MPVTTARSAGTSLAIDRVFGEYADKLSQNLKRRVACEENARDIAQEACLRLFVEWQRRRDIQNPRAYLNRIAHNLLYLHYTRNAKRAVDAGIDVDSLMDDGDGVEARVDDALRIERINQAWRELPPKCRLALELRWREGLSVAEIADRMCLSRAMIKKYLARGLGHFRLRLGRFVGQE